MYTINTNWTTPALVVLMITTHKNPLKPVGWMFVDTIDEAPGRVVAWAKANTQEACHIQACNPMY